MSDDIETTVPGFVYLKVGSPIPVTGLASLISLCAAMALGAASLLKRKR